MSAIATPIPQPVLKRPIQIAIAVMAACATGVWLWSCLCSFPLHPWNAIRIAPSFMWTAGVTPYPAPGLGPVTTWIYGPLPLLLLWPATLATDSATALLIAGVINLLIMVIPVALVVYQQVPTPVRPAQVVMATLLVVALWPAANLTFWQADNAAIALGYLSFAMLRNSGSHQGYRLWFASAAAILALWAKPTELGPALGQIAWLGLCFGTRAALEHVARCAACGAGAGLVFLSLFGAEGVLFNMFVVPAGLPLVPLLAKATQAQFLPHVLIGVALPTLIVLATLRRVLIRRDTLALSYLMFLTSLPFNLMGFASIGGNVNSLHAHLYLLPALVWSLSLLKTRWAPFFFPGAALMIALALGVHFGNAPVLALRPATGAANQAETLARDYAGRLYLPWHPLATYYAEGRFDHVEDGIMTRALAKRPLTATTVRQHLPPLYSLVAYQEFIYDGFVTRHLVPEDAVQSSFGNWQILSWPPSPSKAVATKDPLKFAPDEPTALDPSTLRP